MLGPLEVRAGSGEVLEVGGTRLRTLLIMLTLRPGQLVPASQLIDGLWPGRVLAACLRVRILATSREPLSITGEALWTVGPLTLPPDPTVTSDETERSGSPALAIGEAASVRLLAQRADAVLPGFEVTAANAPDLALRENRPEWAAQLLGASVAVRGIQDRSVPDDQRVADGARDALGPAVYGEAYRRGQGVALDTLDALAEHRAGPDREVDPVQRPGLAEPLDQPVSKY